MSSYFASLLLWQNPDKKWFGKERFYCLLLSCLSLGRSDRKLEAGTRAETTDKHCLLALFSCIAQLAFFYIPSPHAQGWHFPHWAHLLMKTTHNHAHKSSRLLTSGRDSYSIEISLSHMMTVCLKLPKLNEQSPQNVSVI